MRGRLLGQLDAIQIAAALGAEVTGVCSGRNVELVRSFGADHVVDYTRDDVTRGTGRFDVVLDNVGNHSASAYRRVVKPGGRYLASFDHPWNRWLGPLPFIAGMAGRWLFTRSAWLSCARSTGARTSTRWRSS